MQNDLFSLGGLIHPLYPPHGDLPKFPRGNSRAVTLAVAEALSWLESAGLVMSDPQQPASWYVLTRRATTLRTRADVAAFRKGRVLPVELLQPALAEKIWPLFLRGDHDVAVFQAFKEVEVRVRKAANAKGASYADDLVGVPLMRKAFHPETGPLTDTSLVVAEREGDMALFAEAIAYAKNPTGHRDVVLSPQEGSRLVVLASHLLSIVEKRSL